MKGKKAIILALAIERHDRKYCEEIFGTDDWKALIDIIDSPECETLLNRARERAAKSWIRKGDVVYWTKTEKSVPTFGIVTDILETQEKKYQIHPLDTKDIIEMSDVTAGGFWIEPDPDTNSITGIIIHSYKNKVTIIQVIRDLFHEAELPF